MRNNRWLADRLITIWHNHFPDVPIENEIIVRFGRRAKTRLGSIKFGRRLSLHPKTYITITGYFRDPLIPEYVVDAVLAHEMAHYTHGFYSPRTQLYRQPHKHGVVDKELTDRGLGDIVKKQKKWLKAHWRHFI